jgi:hypothetical protein
MKSKKEALDDAISSTKAAVAEGIVPGGGLARLRCIEALSMEEATCEGDEKDRYSNPEAGTGGCCASDRGKLGDRWWRRRGAHAERSGQFRL